MATGFHKNLHQLLNNMHQAQQIHFVSAKTEEFHLQTEY